MITLPGYTSVYDVILRGTNQRTQDVTVEQIRNALEKVELFFAINIDGVSVGVPRHVISTQDNEYFVFLNEISWSISFDRLRKAAADIGQDFSLPMGFLGLMGGRPLEPIPDVAAALLPLEGRFLAIRETDEASAVMHLQEMANRANPKLPKRRNLSGREAKDAWDRFLRENPGCTALQREHWGSENLQGGREAARNLWKETKPADGSKPGPKKKQS